MRYANTVSLVAIAVVVTTHFALNDLWPAVYLASVRESYASAAIECQVALYAEPGDGDSEGRQGELSANLRLAWEVELAACHEFALLRSKLLAAAVDPNALRAICLTALDDERIPLEAIGLTGGACRD